MIEFLGGIAVAIILASLGVFGWFKFAEEKQINRNLTTENMRLTMENYNLTTRMNKIVPIDSKDRSNP
jgi:hypothetical protein